MSSITSLYLLNNVLANYQNECLVKVSIQKLHITNANKVKNEKKKQRNNRRKRPRRKYKKLTSVKTHLVTNESAKNADKLEHNHDVRKMPSQKQ